MKQLRNILTGVLLACGLSLPAVSMQADSIPAAQNGLVAELDSMAQRDDVTPAEQEENTFRQCILKINDFNNTLGCTCSASHIDTVIFYLHLLSIQI